MLSDSLYIVFILNGIIYRPTFFINAYKAAGVVTMHGYFNANVCVH